MMMTYLGSRCVGMELTVLGPFPMAKKGAYLVATKSVPSVVLLPLTHSQSVSIGVIGQDQDPPHLIRIGLGQAQGASFLRVREGGGGECWVRVTLGK